MADNQPQRNIHRRVERISALATQIAAEEQIAVKLMISVVRAFFTFFAVACLVAGLVFLLRGRHEAAALWGGAGIVLSLGWVIVYAGAKISKRAIQQVRSELSEGGGIHLPGGGRHHHHAASGH
jgi:hypothetical protein